MRKEYKFRLAGAWSGVSARIIHIPVLISEAQQAFAVRRLREGRKLAAQQNVPYYFLLYIGLRVDRRTSKTA